MRNVRGFTLVELLAVVTILSILSLGFAQMLTGVARQMASLKKMQEKASTVPGVTYFLQSGSPIPTGAIPLTCLGESVVHVCSGSHKCEKIGPDLTQDVSNKCVNGLIYRKN